MSARIRLLLLAGLALVAASVPAATAQGSRDVAPRHEDPYQQAVREMLASPAGLAFLDAYIALQRDYLYGVDREALFEGATLGLVEALRDPFTRYLDAEDAEAARRASAATAVEMAMVGDVGVIRIATFEGDHIGARFSIALDTLLGGGAGGVVLDLRGNRGGSILQGLQVLDRFLADGELGYRRVRGVSVPIAYANPRAVSEPVVVLVDADTASTAEIVAGTLQTYGRGRIIGAVTAGKGVGQTSIPLSDGAELRLVSFEWLLPGLRSIESIGLTPDVLVSAAPVDPVTDGAPRPLVSVGEERGDPAMRLAIDALRGLIREVEAAPAEGEAAPVEGEATPATIPVPAVTSAPVLRPNPDEDVPSVNEAGEAPLDLPDENDDEPAPPPDERL